MFKIVKLCSTFDNTLDGSGGDVYEVVSKEETGLDGRSGKKSMSRVRVPGYLVYKCLVVESLEGSLQMDSGD